MLRHFIMGLDRPNRESTTMTDTRRCEEFALIALLVAMLLGGCGQKGDLYLPDTESSSASSG